MDYSERQAAAAELDPGLAENSNRLGVKLFSQLWKENGGNLTISPYSVAAALALAYNGGAGETAEELGGLLGYAPDERPKLNTAHLALMKLLQDGGPGVELKIANSVWGMKGLELRKDYLKTGKDFYDAQIKTTDLAAPKSVKQINGWVADHTGDKITEMLAEPPGPQAVAVLVNALYFKGSWRNVFPDHATMPGDFHLPDGKTVQAMMMERGGFFPYAEGEKWQAVKLAYGEGQMEMVVFLPTEQSSLRELAGQLEQGTLPLDQEFESSRGTLRGRRAGAGLHQGDALQLDGDAGGGNGHDLQVHLRQNPRHVAAHPDLLRTGLRAYGRQCLRHSGRNDARGKRDSGGLVDLERHSGAARQLRRWSAVHRYTLLFIAKREQIRCSCGCVSGTW